MTIVQGANGSVNRCLEAHGAARAEINHRPPRLMHRTVADQNEIGGEQCPVVAQETGEVRRAGFEYLGVGRSAGRREPLDAGHARGQTHHIATSTPEGTRFA